MANTSAGFLRALRAVMLTAAVVALATACGGAGGPVRSIASGLPRIHKDGIVRVCSTGDYRPFTYRDPQDRWSGLDVDMARNLADRLGVRLDLVVTSWGTLLTDLGSKCDLAMGGITITLGRAQQALYSAPYLRDGKAAIARCADVSKYQTLADIDRPGVRIVVNPGGTNADFDKEHIQHARIVTYPDNNTIFEQLANDTADVMITDASEIRWQTKQDLQLCGIGVDRPFTFEQKASLIPQNDFDMQQWVNQWLNIVENDGTYAAISQKYFGQVIGP
jgi:cyclohexadienyl dehydratase